MTVQCAPGDNLMLHAGVELCQRGDVLLLCSTSPSSDGAIGNLPVDAMQNRGAVGAIVDVEVRDVADVRAMGFRMWGHVTYLRGHGESGPGLGECSSELRWSEDLTWRYHRRG